MNCQHNKILDSINFINCYFRYELYLQNDSLEDYLKNHLKGKYSSVAEIKVKGKSSEYYFEKDNFDVKDLIDFYWSINI